jgi:hypothetical protein
VAEIASRDGTRLHVEVEGEGEPVTVFAHGLTNSCMELAAFTPMAPGTKLRFCFRGHAHFGTPEPGHYRFADSRDDLDAVATAVRARRERSAHRSARARSRICSAATPIAFERVVFVLPAALDVTMTDHARFDHVADLLETLPVDEAVAAIVSDSTRRASTTRSRGCAELDMFLWQGLNAVGVARSIREITRDVAISDRELLRARHGADTRSCGRRATRSIRSSSPRSWSS